MRRRPKVPRGELFSRGTVGSRRSELSRYDSGELIVPTIIEAIQRLDGDHVPKSAESPLNLLIGMVIEVAFQRDAWAAPRMASHAARRCTTEVG